MKFFIFILAIFLTACAANQVATDKQDELADTYIKLAMGYLQQKRTGLALERANRALEIQADNPEANYVYALAQQRNKNYKTSAKHLQTAIRLKNGKYPEAKNALAVNLCLTGNKSKARKIFNELLDDDSYKTPKLAKANLKKC